MNWASLVATGLKLLRRFWYVIPILALTVALLITRGSLADRTAERDRARAFGEQVTAVTRQASGNLRLAQRDVPVQIAAFGASLRALEDGLTRCNASARAAAENDATRQATAAERLRAVQARLTAQASLVARLRASAGATTPGGASCEPSETVREIWR